MDYFISVDGGVASTGFAVTDENYNLIKKSGKYLWGVRLFEEGQGASERRVSRSGRRRLQRKKERLELLRTLFTTNMALVDSDFFQRLDESMLHKKDRTIEQSNSLFFDNNYTDKDYHKAYPTIYHLRSALCRGEVTDIRLLYLGLTHILKSRGHFLFEGEFSFDNSFEVVFNSLNDYLVQNSSSDDNFEFKVSEEVKAIFKNSSLSIKDKSKALEFALGVDKDQKDIKAIIGLMIGGAKRVGDIFTDIEFEDEDKKVSIDFKKSYDENIAKYQQILGDKFYLIELSKAIYDWMLLSDILGDDKFLSEAKIKTYEQNKEDLKLLKSFVRTYRASEYKNIFMDSNSEKNYVAYIGLTKRNGKKVVVTKGRCSQEDFCAFLAQKLPLNDVVDEKYVELISKIKEKNFLPRLRSKSNVTIPHQIHLMELEVILKACSSEFPFLNEIDSQYNITTAEKIKSIFQYRIPYYIGPLNPHSKFAWIEKYNNEKIYPWNFEKVVNIEASAEAFISRMTNDCTYLIAQKVLPKNSILYSKYMVLNELNNLKIDGEKIKIAVKQLIFNKLFKNTINVTQKGLIKFLQKECLVSGGCVITGIDGDFKASLKPYIDFKHIFGEDFDQNEELLEKVENIISWITLFPAEEKMLKARIEKVYPNWLTDEVFNKIKSLKYSGWGRFSREFLTSIKSNSKDIITALYSTNNNLMMLLGDDYGYMLEIEKFNKQLKKAKTQITYNDDIENLYCSTAGKKSIWQAFKIISEVEKIMGCKPKKVFIEVARDVDAPKLRTVSRLNKLREQYKKFKKSYEKEYQNVFSELEDSSLKERDLRSKKLFLYFSQMGRCAYSNEVIDLSNDIYDIDHIYPQSKTLKDDSLHNNLVLVKRVLNGEKGNKFPIPESMRQVKLWKMLLDMNLITKEKFDRLMRTTGFSATELQGFVNRQLVEVRQSTKAIAQLLKEYYRHDKTKVVYTKAEHVSEFRKKFNLTKLRNLNDYHHAHDAFLNIVVGNAFDTKFTTQFLANIESVKYNLSANKFYDYDMKNGNYYAWEATENKSINHVVKTLKNTHILFTRQAVERTGLLFDLTIYKKDSSGIFPVKNPKNSDNVFSKLKDLSLYGGFKSLKGAYFCVVESLKGKKLQRSIEYVPIYLAKDIEADKTLLVKYLQDTVGLVNPRVLIGKLPIKSMLEIDGFPMHLTGRSGDTLLMISATQLLIPYKYHRYLKKIEKVVENLKQNSEYKIPNSVTKDEVKITKETNLELYNILIDKSKNNYKVILTSLENKLVDLRENFENLTIEEQCQTLDNLLNLFKCKSSQVSIAAIGGPKIIETKSFTKIISKLSKVKLINRSVTGFYQSEINLLKFEPTK